MQRMREAFIHVLIAAWACWSAYHLLTEHSEGRTVIELGSPVAIEEGEDKP